MATVNLYSLLFLSACVGSAFSILGYDGYNCASPGRRVVAPCDFDCKLVHNANYGFCGNATEGDFACYCSRPKGDLNLKSIQCVDINDYRYDAVCRTDCLCNHGALDARCNFKTHSCECLGQSENMDLCPFETREEMIQFVIDQKLPNFPVAFDKVKEVLIPAEGQKLPSEQ